MHGASLLAPTQLWAPYSAVLRMWAELSSWAADLLLVGLKKFIRFFKWDAGVLTHGLHDPAP